MAGNPNNTEETVSGIQGTAQLVAAQLTRAAIFLVAKIKPGPDSRATISAFAAPIFPASSALWNFAISTASSPA